MKTQLITLTEYCNSNKIESTFIHSLMEEGLVEVQVISGEEFIDTEQMPTLEQYARWHYEMKINPGGIDALQHMLNKIRNLQKEINYLKSRLHLYE